ncbi:hypothetical protein PMIN04_011022 [Paraphaeosphaeria minitans]
MEKRAQRAKPPFPRCQVAPINVISIRAALSSYATSPSCFLVVKRLLQSVSESIVSDQYVLPHGSSH